MQHIIFEPATLGYLCPCIDPSICNSESVNLGNNLNVDLFELDVHIELSNLQLLQQLEQVAKSACTTCNHIPSASNLSNEMSESVRVSINFNPIQFESLGNLLNELGQVNVDTCNIIDENNNTATTSIPNKDPANILPDMQISDVPFRPFIFD